MKTESETLFEQFCLTKGISLTKIPEGKTKTSDYWININDYKFIIELTQFNINDEEKDLTKSLIHNNIIVYRPGDEKRVRQKIKDKSVQLKPYKDYPTILMFYDNRSIFSTLDQDSIKYALYGDDEYNYSYEAEEDKIVFIERTFGRGKTFTIENKKYISAIGIIKIIDSNCEVILYHNHFAELPLDISICKTFTERQYKIVIDSYHQSDWVKVNF